MLILLGVVLIVLAYLLALPHLVVTLGILCLVVGIVLAVLAATGHAGNGRRWF